MLQWMTTIYDAAGFDAALVDAAWLRTSAAGGAPRPDVDSPLVVGGAEGIRRHRA
jgi:hypothetical protein